MVLDNAALEDGKTCEREFSADKTWKLKDKVQNVTGDYSMWLPVEGDYRVEDPR